MIKKYNIGDKRNGYEVLPEKNRKRMLLLSDDLRMSSGVGTMSNEIVLGIVHQYSIVQVGGAIKHPENGKIVNISKDVEDKTGVPDASVLIYPTNGYGNQELVRFLIGKHNIDFILHFTDPRFWSWLYQMEHEIRQQIPIFYYALWDSMPFPMWNAPFYASCDLIMGISKQSHNIHRYILSKYGINTKDISDNSTFAETNKHSKLKTVVAHVPHGVNENLFFPINKNDKHWNDLLSFKSNLIGKDNFEFIVFYNSRNIRRKMTGDVILAYKTFCDMLTEEQAKKCALVLHTTPIDKNGTDLPAVVDAICPNQNVIFSHKKLKTEYLNYLYNISDVTINISSNEGWGLSTTESLLAGTPIIVNVTGGLADQCGFLTDDGLPLSINDFNETWSSNHDGKYKKCGAWVKPVFPKTRSLVGSIPTPYIFDDRCDWEDAAKMIFKWYNTSKNTRDRYGKLGRKYAMDSLTGMASNEMAKRFIKYQNEVLSTWTPRYRFKVLNCSDYKSTSLTNGISLSK